MLWLLRWKEVFCNESCTWWVASSIEQVPNELWMHQSSVLVRSKDAVVFGASTSHKLPPANSSFYHCIILLCMQAFVILYFSCERIEIDQKAWTPWIQSFMKIFVTLVLFLNVYYYLYIFSCRNTGFEFIHQIDKLFGEIIIYCKSNT